MSWACKLSLSHRAVSAAVRVGLLALVCCILLPGRSPALATEVLVDQAHGQRFLIEGERPLDLSGLAEVFRDQGARVRSGSVPFTRKTLTGVDVLILAGPFVATTAAEVSAVTDFLHQGGRLVITAHISRPLAPLLASLGVAISLRPVGEQNNHLSNRPTDFKVVDLVNHPLLNGLTSFNMYGAWALQCRNETVRELARTSAQAWLDIDQNGRPDGREPVGAFPLVVSGRLGKGHFVVFGDDALFQNRFLAGENLQLAKNLAAWFCGMGVEI